MHRLFNTHPLVVDKHLAKILGLNEALVLQQINYWIEINKKNNNNFHDGRYWTYNTINEWQEEFPFWSTETVKRIFKRLREKNLIITNNYNKMKMDRTLWYSINYEELERLTNDENCSNGLDQKEPKDEDDLNQALPEISSDNSSEISNQSISLLDANNIKEERQIDRQCTTTDFNTKYSNIIANCELYAIDKSYREAVAHAIKLLLLDIEKSKRIKIGDNYIPVEIVEQDIEKLDFFVIEHAVNKFREASERIEIRNTVAYLKTCIYNAINEIQIDADSKLRYEGLI